MQIAKFLFSNFLLIVLIFSARAQEQYEYFGVVKLKDSKDQMISYRLVFKEEFGKITGYSITDLAGEHETKNLIEGMYNPVTKEFIFNETDIVYTKSPIVQEDFCYIHFKGGVKLHKENSKLEGNFEGLYNNGRRCIDGTIVLVGSQKIYNQLGRLDKKIQKTKMISKEDKENFKAKMVLDTLRTNFLIKGQNLNVFWKSEEYVMDIWDNGKVDGDRINLFHNDQLILNNYTVVSNKKRIKVPLVKGKNTFKIVALSEGEIPPNTAMVQLIDEKETIEMLSNLKKGESATITIIKK